MTGIADPDGAVGGRTKAETLRLLEIAELAGCRSLSEPFRVFGEVFPALFERARSEHWSPGQLAVALFKAYPADELGTHRKKVHQ